MLAFEVNPAEVKRRMQAGERLRLIDVREPWEFERARIEGSELIPMRTIPESLGHLDESAADLIVLCHHGVRSLRVVSWLREQGVENCASLEGGIDRWSLEIDPTVPRYE
jgi:rhodanese-related sulfurtransferase